MRPVEAGLISFEALRRTEITLLDVALLNDHLDAKAENEARWRRWQDLNRSRR